MVSTWRYLFDVVVILLSITAAFVAIALVRPCCQTIPRWSLRSSRSIRSLAFIDNAGLDRGDGIIDIGGGASTLVDDLLNRGYRNVTVLDISALAIARAKERLGARAKSVSWLLGDITSIKLPEKQA